MPERVLDGKARSVAGWCHPVPFGMKIFYPNGRDVTFPWQAWPGQRAGLMACPLARGGLAVAP